MSEKKIGQCQTVLGKWRMNQMKKELKISMYYLVFALISGVFYREFTKWNGFVGTTALSKTHLHLFVLGTFLYLILALFVMATDLKQQKEYSIFQKVYQYALPSMIILFYVRGIVQVLNIQSVSYTHLDVYKRQL